MASDVPDDLPTPERIQELEDMLKPEAKRPVAKVPSNSKPDEGAQVGALLDDLTLYNASQAPDHSFQKPLAKKVAVATPSKRKRDDEANEDRANSTGTIDEIPPAAQPPKKK